eukprot:scaffold29369_cov57-Cyclotella_meneghiniana.AAC.2
MNFDACCSILGRSYGEGDSMTQLVSHLCGSTSDNLEKYLGRILREREVGLDRGMLSFLSLDIAQ